MKLPVKDYTLDSFLETIAENMDEIFGQDEQRKWLKTYLMYTDDEWLDLFQQYKPMKLGELFHIVMPFEEDGGSADYYVYEIAKGMLMFFTTSKRTEYTETLKEFVRHTQGITQMWLPPESFEKVINYLLSTYSANIYSFITKRHWSSKYPAKLRSDFTRMIHYSGDDASYTLKELQELYGVLPSLVDLKIGSDKIRVTNDGLFMIRTINRKMLRLVVEVIDRILAEQVRLRGVSRQVEYTSKPLTVGNIQLNVSSIMSGRISLNTKLSAHLMEKLFKGFEDEEVGRTAEGTEVSEFSFIDTSIREGSLSFSATVIDEDKGTIFGLSGNENEMILVPKHRITFESFIRFFRLVNETLDDSSNLLLFSEQVAR